MRLYGVVDGIKVSVDLEGKPYYWVPNAAVRIMDALLQRISSDDPKLEGVLEGEGYKLVAKAGAVSWEGRVPGYTTVSYMSNGRVNIYAINKKPEVFGVDSGELGRMSKGYGGSCRDILRACMSTGGPRVVLLHSRVERGMSAGTLPKFIRELCNLPGHAFLLIGSDDNV